MIQQDWEGKALDKDIIIPGNKRYSPESCAFVGSKLNSILNDHRSTRGKLPQGVGWLTGNKNFIAKVNHNGSRVFIGMFDTKEEASAAYIKAKVKIILDSASEQTDIRIATGLRLHAELLMKS